MDGKSASRALCPQSCGSEHAHCPFLRSVLPSVSSSYTGQWSMSSQSQHLDDLSSSTMRSLRTDPAIYIPDRIRLRCEAPFGHRRSTTHTTHEDYGHDNAKPDAAGAGRLERLAGQSRANGAGFLRAYVSTAHLYPYPRADYLQRRGQLRVLGPVECVLPS